MKKVLALTLATVLAFGMMSTAFAVKADGWDDSVVKGVDDLTAAIGQSAINKGKDMDGTVADVTSLTDLENLDVSADVVLQFTLNPKAFTYDGTAPTILSTGILSNLKVNASFTKGGSYWKKPVLKSNSKRGAFIEIATEDWYVATKDNEYNGKVTLTIKGDKQEIPMSGYLKNKEVLVDEGEEFLAPTRFEYLNVDGYCKAVEIDLDNGLVYNTRLYANSKYYIGAKEGIEASDDDKVAKYDIDTVFTVKYTKNLETPSGYMTFDLDDTMYVYDDNGKLLGTTKDKVKLSPKYYLSVNKLEDFETGEDTIDQDAAPEEEGDNQNPAGGGDDGVANENDNPGTGSNGLMNVAVVAGVVALAAAGAVSLKK